MTGRSQVPPARCCRRDADADLTNKDVVAPYVAAGFVVERSVVLSAIQVRPLEA
jgi:hypothetical protein